jgi:tellurite resistance protein TehA-like permease
MTGGLGPPTPASGAIVMGTGIVSTALASDRRHVLSLVLLTMAAALWVILGAGLTVRIRRDWPGVARDSQMPAALTSVAATAVLGARATGVGWSGVAAALLTLGTILWLILLAPVLLRLRRRPAAGAAFMATVSTQSLAVLAAQLALRMRASWLLYSSVGWVGLGLSLYGFVLARFDFRQLLNGRGDHWVSGGALAISTLAAARIALAAHGLHVWSAALRGLDALTLGLWAASAAWLLVLIPAEAVRPRLDYDVRRWATVFPVGMYAACSFDAGRATNIPGLTAFAQQWVWLALSLWLVVAGATAAGAASRVLTRRRSALN